MLRPLNPNWGKGRGSPDSILFERPSSDCTSQFSCSVMSNSLWPHGLQHTRPPCPSPTPGVYSNSCPSSWWCHPTISFCHPLLLPSIFPSNKVFSNESVLCIRWPKNWSFSFSISPSSDHSGPISFGIDWFDLLAVQGTLKRLLQHHSSKSSILRRSAFFMVQLSHPYMTTGKAIALTRWTFVGKVMSLLFNMLCRFVIAFLPRSKHILISWLQLQSAVILKPKNIKSLTVSIVSPFICHEMMGPDAMILVFWMLSKMKETLVSFFLSLAFILLLTGKQICWNWLMCLLTTIELFVLLKETISTMSK